MAKQRPHFTPTDISEKLEFIKDLEVAFAEADFAPVSDMWDIYHHSV